MFRRAWLRAFSFRALFFRALLFRAPFFRVPFLFRVSFLLGLQTLQPGQKAGPPGLPAEPVDQGPALLQTAHSAQDLNPFAFDVLPEGDDACVRPFQHVVFRKSRGAPVQGRQELDRKSVV